MKKIAYIALAALLAACGNQNDFPEISKPTPPVVPPGTTDGGVNYYGEYEGTPSELVGTYGTTTLKTLDIQHNTSPVTETETVVKAPAEGYEDFVENYGYDEATGETDNAVKQLKFNYSDGKVVVEYYSKKGNLKDRFSTSKTVIDDDDDSTEAYVEINGQHVTVKALKKFNYILTGKGSEGSSFKIYSDKKFLLTLQDVTLQNDRGAAINIQKSFNPEEDGKYKGKRAYLIIKGSNTLQDSNAEAYIAATHPNEGVEEDEKGVVFNEGKLLVSGNGTLTVSARGKHGIVSDDYVYMHAGPAITVTAANGCDAVKTNDGIRIAGGIHNYSIIGEEAKGLNSDSTIIISGGRMTITDATPATAQAPVGQMAVNGSRVIMLGGELNAKTPGTGVCAEKVFVMNAGSMALLAVDGNGSPKDEAMAVATNEVYLNGGTLAMRANNGIVASNRFTMTGGFVEAYTSDNAIKAAKNISVKGGGIYAVANDAAAIVSEGIISINGGVVFANATNSTDAAIDCSNNLFDIDGGILIAVGEGNSTPTAAESSQEHITGTANAGGVLNAVSLADGSCPAAFKAESTVNETSLPLLFSAPGLSKDNCTITEGESATINASTGVSFHDVYANGVTITK